MGQGFNFEREVITGTNLIVRLNEEQKLAESLFHIGVLKLALNIFFFF